MSKLFDLNKYSNFKIENKKEDKKSVLYLYAAIGEDFWEDGSSVSARKFSDELNKIPAGNTIEVRINSPGGSVFDGITMYERLKQHKSKVIVYIDGIAASIASVIAMAGDEIHIGEGSMLMIHKPWTMAMGNDLDFQNTIEVLQKIEDQMVGIYARKTGMSRAEISNMLMKDKWITSDEAKEMGFVTNIVEANEGLQVAASMIAKASWLKNAPKIDHSAAKAKVLDFKSKVDKFLAR